MLFICFCFVLALNTFIVKFVSSVSVPPALDCQLQEGSDTLSSVESAETSTATAPERCPLSICGVNDLFMKVWLREVTSLDVYFRKMTSVEGRLEERHVRRLWPRNSDGQTQVYYFSEEHIDFLKTLTFLKIFVIE